MHNTSAENNNNKYGLYHVHHISQSIVYHPHQHHDYPLTVSNALIMSSATVIVRSGSIFG